MLPSVDEQNSYLYGLIIIREIQNRRTHLEEGEAFYSYSVRYLDDNKKIREVLVWSKEYLSVHRISKKKAERLQKSLKEMGMVPKDRRGKHSSRPRKLSSQQQNAIVVHIGLFRCRKVIIILKSSKKYLPDELNSKKV